MSDESNPYASLEDPAKRPTRTVPSDRPPPSPEAGKHLSGARWMFVIIGLIWIAMYGYQFSQAEKEVQQLFKQDRDMAGLQGEERAEAVATVLLITRGIYVALGSVGLLFILLGIFVYQYPRFCTVTGMVVYLLTIGLALLLNPQSILSGIVVKILVIVGLYRSIQGAYAYHEELQSYERKRRRLEERDEEFA
jgi:hypothetical protein